MPRRTNLFQEVIDMVQRILAPDATFESSAMLVDQLTGQMREVDIVRSAGGEIVGIEATSTGRKATVPWVDQQHSKHSRLETTQLVLVSEAGFAGTARNLATKLGHLTVDPSDDLHALEKDFLFVGQPGTIIVRDLSLDPEIYLAVVVATGAGEALPVDADLETMLVRADATPLLSVGDYFGAEWAANLDNLRSEARDLSPDERRKGFELRRELPTAMGEDLYLTAEDGAVERVELVVVRGTFEYQDEEIEMRHGVLWGKAVSYGEMKRPGRRGVIVGTDASGDERLHIRSHEPPSSERPWLLGADDTEGYSE